MCAVCRASRIVSNEDADCRRRRAYDPLRGKGPPTSKERAADYALPLKRQENCRLKETKKPRAATARQVFTPGVRMDFDIWLQEVLKHTYRNLTLTICLRMERSAQSQICSENLEKLFPEMAGDLWIAI